MSTIDLEVMKQLIREFSDKEALITEEVNVVQQQIEELKQRVNHCQAKLTIIGEDKEKIVAMYERYSSGASLPTGSTNISLYPDNTSPLPQPSPSVEPVESQTESPKSIFSEVVSTPISTSIPTSTPARARRALRTVPALAQVSNPPVDAPATNEDWEEKATVVEETTQNTVETSEAAPSQEEASRVNEDSPPEETVKSINDALRGLFR